ncbi:Scr1 family TA system antitoxin-like transcriptional regulator [Streptomyces sp. B21-105]|uniref:Scr1 family TA system antitoxin-like transcriptional regulator n=1 Tax=Streptomyces sp. B21-105 TaxID=3039417 RepID=UPI002FF12CAD
MQFGGRRTTREQLQHLCEMSERESIDIRVLTTDVGAFPGAGHAVLYAHGAVPQLDTVQLDSAHGGEFTHAKAQLAKCRAHMTGGMPNRWTNRLHVTSCTTSPANSEEQP